jgi:hypothetical protein
MERLPSEAVPSVSVLDVSGGKLPCVPCISSPTGRLSQREHCGRATDRLSHKPCDILVGDLPVSTHSITGNARRG